MEINISGGNYKKLCDIMIREGYEQGNGYLDSVLGKLIDEYEGNRGSLKNLGGGV